MSMKNPNSSKYCELLVSLSAIFAYSLSGCATARNSNENPWAGVTTPTRAMGASARPAGAQAIGFYSAGCLRGGVSLPPDGPGYQVVRITRRRFYGHPSLIEFIGKLGKAVARRKLGALLIGDLAQPRGGPTGTMHMSHQTGLDVDIWFALAPAGRELDLDARETLSAPSVVAASGDDLDPATWKPAYVEILKAAAGFDEVQRVLVNPAVKRALCRAPGLKTPAARAWLAKLRPWYGHDDHFHVRLRCPASDVACKTQEDVGQGDGCDATLDWWFTEEAKLKAKAEAAAGPPPLPKLPDACTAVLQDN